MIMDQTSAMESQGDKSMKMSTKQMTELFKNIGTMSIM